MKIFFIVHKMLSIKLFDVYSVMLSFGHIALFRLFQLLLVFPFTIGEKSLFNLVYYTYCKTII